MAECQALGGTHTGPVGGMPPAQAGGNSEELQAKSKAMKEGIAAAEEEEKAVIAERDAKLVLIGNVVHDSVPISDDEVGAQEQRVRWAVHPLSVCVGGRTLGTRATWAWHATATAALQANNAIVKEWGTPRQEDKLYNHVDLVQVSSLHPWGE